MLGKKHKESFLLSSKYIHSVISTDKSNSSHDATQKFLNNINESLCEISEKI